METLKKILGFSFITHLGIGVSIRVLLVLYSTIHDKRFEVPYTDIDYKVFSDAAKHVYEGNSPYLRHTYRYSPLIAFLLIPNVYLAQFGKLLFVVFDILVAIAVKTVVERQFQTHPNASKISTFSALYWIYNPMSVAISTRGNADSLPCFFIILSILFLQTDVVNGLLKYLISGIFLGFSIHLRLYPLALSFPMYLSLGEYKINRRTSFSDGIISLLPNKKQIVLTLSCIFTLSALTLFMYYIYGYEFLFETYLYHATRKDTKHNFSILFYYSYLTKDNLSFDLVKLLLLFCLVVVLFVVSMTFGVNSETLPFALFAETFLLVAFNSVMTSQYFIWFLSLLPLVAHSFEMTASKAVVLFALWLGTQGAWLVYGYILEFLNRDVFLHIWLKSMIFFISNVFIFSQLLETYKPRFGFGYIDRVDKNK